jgi:RND superfamily putative drug exporter
VSVFLAFVSNDDAVVKMFGLGPAVSILVDATVIRQCVVPSAMALAGNADWWFPGWLGRVAPRIDLDGPPHPTPSLRESPT